MKLHSNAALSLNGRRRLVRMVIEQGRSIRAAAEAASVSERTCSKWVARYRVEGDPGLLDRSSAPGRVHNRTDEHFVQLLVSLRRLRFTAPELADLLDMPVSMISGILKRIGLGKLGRLGLERVERYERARPGELIHVDVKKFGRTTATLANGSQAARETTQPRATRLGRCPPQSKRLGHSARRDRRCDPPGLSRGSARRESNTQRPRSYIAPWTSIDGTASRSSA
jgi:transposase